MDEDKVMQDEDIIAFGYEVFNGDKVLIEAFRELVKVGQSNSIKRNLTLSETENLAENYINHLKEAKVTRKDLIKQIISYKMAQRDLRVKAHNDKGGKQKRPVMSPLAKMRFASTMASDLGYKPKYKFAKSLRMMKEFDVRKQYGNSGIEYNNDRLAYLHEHIAEDFTAMSLEPRRDTDFFDLSEDEYEAIFDAKKLSVQEGMNKNMFYRGNPRVQELVKQYAATAVIVGAVSAVALGAVGIAENKAAYENSRTMQAAHEAGYVTSDFLSDSRSDVEIFSWEQPQEGIEDRYAARRYVKELLQEHGTAGLYDDLQTRLEQYSTQIPSAEERQILYEELDQLPDYVFNEKFLPLYDELKRDDGYLYGTADSVELKQNTDPENAAYMVVFYRNDLRNPNHTRMSLASAESKELKPYYEADLALSGTVSKLRDMEQELASGQVDEYEIYARMQETIKNAQKPLTEIGKLATQDLTAKKAWFLFSNKIDVQDRTFKADEGEER